MSVNHIVPESDVRPGIHLWGSRALFEVPESTCLPEYIDLILSQIVTPS